METKRKAKISKTLISVGSGSLTTNKSKAINITKACLPTGRLKMLLLLITIGSTMAYANNIVVSNVSLTGQNTTLHYTMVKFDISWDNS